MPEGGDVLTEHNLVDQPTYIKTKMPGYVRHTYEKRPNDYLQLWMPFNPNYNFINLSSLLSVPKQDKFENAFYETEPTMKVFNARVA